MGGGDDVKEDEGEGSESLGAKEESLGMVQKVAMFARERTKVTVGVVAIVAGVVYLFNKKFFGGSGREKKE